MTSQPPARPLIVTFALGPHRLGLPAGDLREVVFLPDLIRSPGLPAVVEGFADLRGEVLPVIRLDRLLGLEECLLRLYTPLLVLATPRCALTADKVCDLVEMEEASLREMAERETLPGGLAAAVAGAFRQEGRLLPLLVPGRLMGLVEQRILEDLAAAERRRRTLWEGTGMEEGEAPCR